MTLIQDLAQDTTIFPKVCDIAPCGIAGRNYPFPKETAGRDSFIGIGGGLKYSFYECDEKLGNLDCASGFYTTEDYISIAQRFQLTAIEGSATFEEDSEIDKNHQSLAFNSLYAKTVMDILQINEIHKPGKGHDSWLFGLASSNVTVSGTKFLKYFEWSSSRLQLHVFPDTGDTRFKNINDETIANDLKYFKWDVKTLETVDTIVERIEQLNESFNTALAGFNKLVLNGTDEENLAYCDNIEEGLSKEDCLHLIEANAEIIKCGSKGTASFKNCEIDVGQEASIFATGGLRNNVREAVDLLDNVIDGSDFVSDGGILSGSEEALYGFLAANIGVPNEDLNNVFDFGGQSIQLTKVIRDDLDLPAYSNDRQIQFGPDTIDYFALSVNNIGTEAAAAYIADYWAREEMENACLLNYVAPGVFDEAACLDSLRLMLEPVTYYKEKCLPYHIGNSSLSNLMGISFVLMISSMLL